MIEFTSGEIRESLQNFEDYSSDLVKSNSQSFEGRLKVLMKFCQNDPVFKIIHFQIFSVTNVSFSNWYEGIQSTKNGDMWGKISFPTGIDDRISIMYQLLDRISRGEINLVDDIAFPFYYLGRDTKKNRMVQSFNDDVVLFLAREILKKLKKLENTLPKDAKEFVSGNTITIINSGSNAVQQVSVGNKNKQNLETKDVSDLIALFNSLHTELYQSVDNEAMLNNKLEVLETIKKLSQKGSQNYSSIKVLLDSLGAGGNIVSIISGILAILPK